jgi:hypothetical protein
VTFPNEDLAALAVTEEIEVETRSASGDVHRAIVWPVVRDDVVYLRSFRAERGRWYREALADPSIALIVDGRRLPARAEPAADPSSIEACSAGLRVKYKTHRQSLAAMLTPEVLPTTVRVVPP